MEKSTRIMRHIRSANTSNRPTPPTKKKRENNSKRGQQNSSMCHWIPANATQKKKCHVPLDSDSQHLDATSWNFCKVPTQPIESAKSLTLVERISSVPRATQGRGPKRQDKNFTPRRALQYSLHSAVLAIHACPPEKNSKIEIVRTFLVPVIPKTQL